ncbi:hypothetical protein OsJ_31898 [Oryza sativa Japonica Group]|uniref:Uncharacterized protein n=1 Tax=Oryza sativa subsp. japonica TaxID=39947 RepID=A3C5R5_ORYSJ|nr:hypothetical protein OsJ_31898 [Oryza sativa Japonica Group]
MGRAPCCEKEGLRRGAWSPRRTTASSPTSAATATPTGARSPSKPVSRLLRCGKSCRLRWINYLRPDIKRGNFTADEEDLIVRLHNSLGNRWSAIAAQMPGRTDNEIKNVWHTHLKKRLDDERKLAAAGGGGGRRPHTRKQPKAAKSAAAVKREATPSVSVDTSSGVTCSTVTESSPSSADGDHRRQQQQTQHAAVKEESFSSGGELPAAAAAPTAAADMDESFWSSTEVTGMMAGLGDMDEELAIAGTSSAAAARSDDMEFWLKMLLESGDMGDLAVLKSI